MIYILKGILNNMYIFPTRKGSIGLKEAIVTTLAEEFPLSINQLKARYYRTSGKKVSYQAVHKELAHLLEIGVVIREGSDYLLNPIWLKSLAEFFTETERAYARSKRLHPNVIKRVQNDGDVVSLEFSSLNELDEFFVSVMDAFETLAQNKPIIMHYRHNWYPLLYAKKEGQVLERDPEKKRFFCLCGGNTPLDRWSIDYENAIGMNVKYKRGVGQKWDLQVYGDAIIQFHLDPLVIEKIDRFFEVNKRFLEYNPKDLLGLMSLSGKFSVMIYRNALLAEQLRKETIAEFTK